jgi:TP901 family phage tail tape measure protein
MAMNMEAVLRIAAKVTGLQDLGVLEKGLLGAEKAAGGAASGFKAMVNSAAWQGMAAAAAGLGVAIGLSVKSAIEFESAMAEVAKVVDGIDTPQGMKEIRAEIFGLSREIPIAAKGFAEMYAAAGQAGVPRKELRQFAIDVSKVAIAFDMTAAEAGTAMAKLRTNLGLTQPELMKLADAANYLSNNMASTASEIVEFMLRSGAAGKQAGLSAEQTAAFGSAMIASGAQSEVAATSFNNMVKALSRGSSMTARQTSALVTLGYAQKGAVQSEAQLTQAVERESADRVRAIEQESRQMVSDIGRRYRDIAMIQQDSWDDEAREWSRRQDDRYGAVSKSLQRERQAEIDASNERAKQGDYDNRRELEAIEDKYEERLTKLRRQQEDERTEIQRRARDYQQDVKDQLDDQRQMEVDAVNQKFEELKKIEELRKKEAIESAKATAAAMVGELGPNLAKMLQQDAVGTIRDVFARIKALPAEMQMSVISDLFGDEARALLPLITNSKLLDDALNLVGDSSKYAGSTLAEYLKRVETTEAKLQLAKNNLNELSTVFGENFLPAIKMVLDVFAPLIRGLTWMVTNVPLLGPAVALITSAFVGLVAVAPFISGFITLLGQLGITAAGIAAKWAGLQTVFIVAAAGMKTALAGLLTWLGSIFLPAALAVITGPVGWTVLAVAAVVAMAILFRKPLQDFAGWLVGWGKPIGQFFVNLWDGTVKLARNAVESVKSIFVSMGAVIKGAFNGILRNIFNSINSAINNINFLINRANALSAKVYGPQLPILPILNVPQFAKGGYVGGGTLAVVGEAGPEYIIPERKMAQASMNYLGGARGGAVIPAYAQGGYVGGNAQINVTTGPVMQQDGQQYVSMADLERAMRKTADGIYASLRTPAGRYAMGVR